MSHIPAAEAICRSCMGHHLQAEALQVPLFSIPLGPDELPYRSLCATADGFSLHADSVLLSKHFPCGLDRASFGARGPFGLLAHLFVDVEAQKRTQHVPPISGLGLRELGELTLGQDDRLHERCCI